MVTSVPPTSGGTRAARPQLPSLKVQLYDQVASMLIALLVLIGALVVCLFLVWLSTRIFVTQQSVPVVMQDVGGGREDGVVGESLKIESPDPQQIARETDLQEPQIQKTLATLIDAVARIQVDLDDPALTEQVESGASGSSQGTGKQVGLGSGDGPGYGFPRGQRWVIRFQEGGSLDSYARQLDFFHIELGAIGNSSQIAYAYNLAKPTPDRRQGRGDQEQRLYFTWQDGTLRAADMQLLTKAGISTEGKIQVQFYPPEVENLLAQLEVDFAKRDPGEIRRTRFGVRGGPGNYQFYVIDQTYLR